MSDLIEQIYPLLKELGNDEVETLFIRLAKDFERLTADLAEHNQYANELSLDLMSARARVEALEGAIKDHFDRQPVENTDDPLYKTLAATEQEKSDGS